MGNDQKVSARLAWPPAPAHHCSIMNFGNGITKFEIRSTRKIAAKLTSPLAYSREWKEVKNAMHRHNCHQIEHLVLSFRMLDKVGMLYTVPSTCVASAKGTEDCVYLYPYVGNLAVLVR